MKKSEVVNWEELQIEDIVGILEREGITTQSKILEEIKKIKLEMEQQIKNSSRMN